MTASPRCAPAPPWETSSCSRTDAVHVSCAACDRLPRLPGGSLRARAAALRGRGEDPEPGSDGDQLSPPPGPPEGPLRREPPPTLLPPPLSPPRPPPPQRRPLPPPP